jgi:hypothetical protein
MEHLQNLRKYEAPTVLLENAEQRLAEGVKRVGHIKQFGSLLFTTVEEDTGKRGRTFLRFKTGKGDIIYALNNWGKHTLFVATK